MITKKRLVRDFLPYVASLKKKYGLKTYETHVHPYDVIGVVHYDDYVEVNPGEFVFKKFAEKWRSKNKADFIGWLSKLDYNKYAFSLFNFALQIIPGYERFDLRHAFARTGIKRLLEEMDEALVDEAVLLPVEPWLPTEHLDKVLAHQRVRLLGSVDIQHIALPDIKNTIKHFVDDYGIIGLKMHPNMQSFLPQPSHNPSDLAEKLLSIYQTADEFGLYLLFHGGPSGLARKLDDKYETQRQESRNGLLINFCDEDGQSELLGQYQIPIVIAHLGHFGAPKLNSALSRTILDKYERVYFDTAGAPSGAIQKFIEWGGSRRLLMGTDALYFKIIYSMHSVYRAARKARTGENLDEIMINILGRNFEQRILNGRKK
jgi:predicted TIM-barrel fold metal-dependent hydrolase